MAILVDQWTTDGAVALAAALRDHRRAVIIGEATGSAMGEGITFAGPRGGS